MTHLAPRRPGGTDEPTNQSPGADRRDRHLADEAARRHRGAEGRARSDPHPGATSTSSGSSANAPSSRTTAAERREEREAMLGLAGEDLIRKVLVLADDFDRAIDSPADASSPATRGSRASPRSTASSGPCSRARASTRSMRRPVDRSTRASTRRSPRCPGTGRPEGEIVEEVRRGYRLRDRVVRPALVAVAAAPDEGSDPSAPINRIDPRPQPELIASQETADQWPRSSASTSGRRTASSR